MNPVTQLRFSAALKRLFSTKAQDPGQILDPIIKPVAELQDHYQPEQRFTRGERLYGQAVDVQNIVATGGEAILWNASAGNMVVIKRIRVSGAVPGNAVQPGRGGVLIEVFNANAQTSGNHNNPKDMRTTNQLSRSTTSTLAGISYAATWANKLLSYNIGNTIHGQELFPDPGGPTLINFDYPEADIVLNPGGQCGVGCWFTTAPTAVWNYTVSFEFFERVLDPAELIPTP